MGASRFTAAVIGGGSNLGGRAGTVHNTAVRALASVPNPKIKVGHMESMEGNMAGACTSPTPCGASAPSAKRTDSCQMCQRPHLCTST